MSRTLLLLALLLCAGPASAQSAKQLNTEGFRLYQAGKLEQAAQKFEAATEADPKHALAHYNLAATLGVLRKRGVFCEPDTSLNNILDHLTTAVRLDPRRLARAKEDADLDPIRNTVGWHRLLGLSPARTEDVPKLLLGVRKWYGPGVGVYGTLRTFTFLEEGKRAVMSQRQPGTEEGQGTEEREGTWSVSGRKVELRFPKGDPIILTLDKQGVLSQQGGSIGTENPITDAPSECEA
ncbi:tetratricopeptide repeat protein [Archangium sp.]|uniref:tetratricopeptide repeat protein n=1 Tax=Archangium sp. TaxID=1872627 RepID=UPI00286B49B4|nr:tetratricopeptide repeat protein [Archangium sp.]